MGGCQNHGPFLGSSVIIRHLVFRGPKKGPQFDNHAYGIYFGLEGVATL